MNAYDKAALIIIGITALFAAWFYWQVIF